MRENFIISSDSTPQALKYDISFFFFLTDGDISKIDALKTKKLTWIYSFAYLKRIKQLNELYARLPF